MPPYRFCVEKKAIAPELAFVGVRVTSKTSGVPFVERDWKVKSRVFSSDRVGRLNVERGIDRASACTSLRLAEMARKVHVQNVHVKLYVINVIVLIEYYVTLAGKIRTWQ